MITYLLSGLLLGVVIALVSVAAFAFLAKRRCWMEIRVSPSPERVKNACDHFAIEALSKDLAELREDHAALVEILSPYLDKASKKQEKHESE